MILNQNQFFEVISAMQGRSPPCSLLWGLRAWSFPLWCCWRCPGSWGHSPHCSPGSTSGLWWPQGWIPLPLALASFAYGSRSPSMHPDERCQLFWESKLISGVRVDIGIRRVCWTCCARFTWIRMNWGLAYVGRQDLTCWYVALLSKSWPSFSVRAAIPTLPSCPDQIKQSHSALQVTHKVTWC